MAKKFNRTAAAVSAAAIALIPFAGVAQAVEVGFEDTVDVGPSLPTGNDASSDNGPAVAGPAAEAEVEAPAESDAPQVGAPAPVEQPVEEAAPVAPVEEQATVVEETTTTTVEETTVVDDVVVDTEDDGVAEVESESDVDANAGTAAYDNGQISAPQLATTGAPVAALTALAGLTLVGTGAAARHRNQ
jgi:hypothetical protein